MNTTARSDATATAAQTPRSPARAAPTTEQRLRRLSMTYERSAESTNSFYLNRRRSDSSRSHADTSNVIDTNEQDTAAGNKSSNSNSNARMRRQSSHRYVPDSDSADLTAYYAFSRRRNSSVSVIRDEAGLSGFLEYKKLDGTWRPFLFQTVDFQLMVYRVHPTHQVSVMTADMRKATEIALATDKNATANDTRVFKLGINGTVITLRAVSHHAALYWIEGLQQLQAGRSLEIRGDRLTLESEDDIFQQIDHLTYLREWAPAPTTTSLCWFCLPPLPSWNACIDKNNASCQEVRT